MDARENLDIELEDIDDELGEAVSQPTAEQPLFRKLKAPPKKLITLAFTVPDSIPQRQVHGTCLVWTREAMAAFAAIYSAAREVDTEYLKNFPFAFLRGSIEVQVLSAIRLKSDMGLSKGNLAGFSKQGARELEPFAYLESTSEQTLHRILQPLLNDWIINNLIPKYAEPGKVDRRLTDRVIDLANSKNLIHCHAFASTALPWPWERKTGTTRSADPLAFQALTDLAARALAGQELFGGLGPMRRLISASGRPNCSELVTAPVKIGEHGRLSLVVSLSVETMPSLHQPLLVMDVSKRRWLESIDEDAFDRSQIGGTVFSDAHPDRAFRFALQRRRGPNGYRWTLDNAYEAIRRTLGLPLHVNDAASLLRGEGNTQTASVRLSYRPGISDEQHAIQAGVPERDKLEAFEEATKLFREFGLQPFEGARRINTSHSTDHQAAARMIEAPTLLGALLEMAKESPNDDSRFTPDYLKTLSPERIAELVLEEFKLNLSQIAQADRLLGASRKGQAAQHALALEQIIEFNREALHRVYGESLPALVLFHEDGPKAESDILLFKAAVKLLWGDLEIVCNRLPKGTHGPESSLDSKLPNGKRAPAADRSQRRVEAWKGVTDQLRRSDKRHACLIMARAYYEDATGTSGGKYDDRVNKPSTRRALASAGCTVQFLLPPQQTKKGVKLADFLMRLQAAMKDLLWAHQGRIDTLPSAVEDCFPNPDRRPREIIGITIVRKESGRLYSNDPSFLPIAVRLDVATGRCDLRFAYETQSGGYTSSRWEQLSDALAQIARLSPVKFAEDPRERKTRFMRFVGEVISESVDDGAQPVVLVDSSNVVNLWPWLADKSITTDEISIGEKQWMQTVWAEARIIRIRHGLAPYLVEDKREALAETWMEDTRSSDQIEPDRSLWVSTSPGSGLFRIQSGADSGCVTYLSVGQKTLHQQKRGVSCYRETMLLGKPKIVKDGRRVAAPKAVNAAGCDTHRLVRYAPHIGQWPSPQPLEIVVTLRQQDDEPDRLAEFVERLRYGFGHYREWTKLPAPLFFERVVRDYISQFDIDDAEAPEAGGTVSETQGAS
mgnify:CR=1 FL=1